MMMAGIWMAEQIYKMPLYHDKDEEVRGIQFAFGQRSFYCKVEGEYWSLAALMVEECSRGEASKPGVELGAKLIEEHPEANTIDKLKESIGYIEKKDE
jgi:hypothetical protein